MKDPVTAVNGITYDRESIQQRLLRAKDTTCPVTKQPLPKDSDLTPNHTLRRLIQAWCIENAEIGVDQIPTSKSPLYMFHIFKLIRHLDVPQLQIRTLKKMEVLVGESQRNQRCMVEAGVINAMVLLIIRCFKEGRSNGLEEALRILHLIWTPTAENKQLVKGNFEFLESIIWVLQSGVDNHVDVKSQAVLVLKMMIEFVSPTLLETLKLDFFKQIVKFSSSLNSNSEIRKKRTTELIFSLLAHLCSCADGRAQLLKHAAGIAMVSKKILRVSPATDDRAVHILSLISKFSATQCSSSRDVEGWDCVEASHGASSKLWKAY
ncbi:hypothetical protein F0562_022375 [Nyssa sinensis]|uniref:U-box domain-containing protein n=1 Tax=Nyssa sinensis TaxID=561372 RepID=A0A5J5BRK9_9ASTE|nr:hypothetical protein F0562_022375 [Nyssa sinensis]